MAEVVSLKKGRLVRQERWGKRRLAYSIERFNEAFYVFFHYEGRPDIPVELERRFKQSDAVLRYLTLKKEAKGTSAGRRRRSPAPKRRPRRPRKRRRPRAAPPPDRPPRNPEEVK